VVKWSGELKRRLVVSGLLWYSDAPRRKKSPSSASQYGPALFATFAVFKQPRNLFMYKEFFQMAQEHPNLSCVGAWQRPCDKPRHTFKFLVGDSVKLALLASMVSAAAYGAQIWPAATHGFQGHDARPEAIVTGGALLVLASLLRRAAWRGRSMPPGVADL